VVFAEFDTTPVPPHVPTPTDLARDASGHIKVPLAPDASQAERDFAAYLESLDGFPPATPGTATFTAGIDPASINTSNVVVLDLTAGTPVSGALASFDAVSRRLTVTASGYVWPHGHTIAIGVRGGPNGLRGEGGLDVVAQPGFFFVRSAKPVANCIAPGPNCVSASPLVPVDQAIQAEAARQALAPALDALESAGLPRDEMAVAWSFTISQRPFGAFDPANGRIAFPNDIVRSQTSGMVTLPISPTDPALVMQLKMSLNQLDGFSTTSRVTAQTDLPPGDTLAAPVPGAIASTMPMPVYSTAGNAIIITPAAPLPEKFFVGVIVTRLLTDSHGVTVEPPPAMVLLRGAGPLYDGMHSTVSELTDAQAALLEQLRMAVHGGLVTLGVDPATVVLAWGYTTQSTVSVLTRRLGSLPDPSSTGAPLTVPAGNPHVASAVAGTFKGSKNDDVPYILTIPQSPSGKLVIFEHGLNGDRTEIFAVADRFAQGGLTVVAMDQPLHGMRAVAGQAFLDFTNLGNLRENVLWSASDIAQLVRTAQGPGLGGNVYSGQPGLCGLSLGGITGTVWAGARSDMTGKLVQSTTGAPLPDIVVESPTFRPQVNQLLMQAGISPDSPEFQQFIDLAHMEVDAADPINYAPRLKTANAPVLAQVASADMVIPLDLGRGLGNRAGATITEYTDSTHAAIINPIDPNHAAVQTDATTFLGGN
jgi:pimeloyl-ACP methyl ester carboxylesterase